MASRRHGEHAYVELSSRLGGRVRDASGEDLGRLTELAVELAGPRPAVVAAEVRLGRRRGWWAGGAIREAPDAVRLVGCRPVDEPPAGSLRLRRDVLDTQVVDLRRRRLARVGDVLLAGGDERLLLVAVEIGRASLLRRLGLGRIAVRLDHEVIAWEHLHPASARGHLLALDAPGAVERLDEEQLQAVVEGLPVHHGAAMLTRTDPSRAASVLAKLDARHRERLLSAAADPHRARLRRALSELPEVARRVREPHRPRLRRPGRHAPP
jgi:hypothetical protein